MKKFIEIYGDKGGHLTVTLSDILKCIHDGNQKSWAILWFEAYGDLGKTSIIDYEIMINNSINGFNISWNDLNELAAKLIQTINIILIADSSPDKIKRYSSDEEMYDSCDYTIELNDSSYWIVNSCNEESIDSMIKSFERVVIVR